MRRLTNFTINIKKEYPDGMRVCTPIEGVEKSVLDYLELSLGNYSVPRENKKFRMTTENIFGRKYILKNEPKEWFKIHVVRRTPYHIEYEYSRKRYKRRYGSPVKAKIGLERSNETVYITSPVLKEDTNDEVVLMYMNLFKNLFNRFEFRDNNFKLPIPVKGNTWTMLKKGERPLSTPELIEYISKDTKKDCQEVEREYASLFKKESSSIEYGEDGFKGYFAFSYDDSRYVIMEKFSSGNATYIFEKENWKQLSKLTKTELIQEKLYVKRILHNDKWNEKIASYIDEI